MHKIKEVNDRARELVSHESLKVAARVTLQGPLTRALEIGFSGVAGAGIGKAATESTLGEVIFGCVTTVIAAGMVEGTRRLYRKAKGLPAKNSKEAEAVHIPTPPQFTEEKRLKLAEILRNRFPKDTEKQRYDMAGRMLGIKADIDRKLKGREIEFLHGDIYD